MIYFILIFFKASTLNIYDCRGHIFHTPRFKSVLCHDLDVCVAYFPLKLEFSKTLP